MISLIMKCINCGKPTKGNKVVCPSCTNVESHTKYLTAHVCKSFIQIGNAPIGVCMNVFSCEPIKKALKNETLFTQLAHIICPRPSVNLSYMIQHEFSDDEMDVLKRNYKECFEE